MTKLKLNTEKINKAMSMALYDSVLLLQERIIEITPRDLKRPPKNPSAKVTGNLKRSIAYQKMSEFQYKIGTTQWMAEYWAHLEFGTVRMEPRSFLRKWIADNKNDIIKHFGKIFSRLL